MATAESLVFSPGREIKEFLHWILKMANPSKTILLLPLSYSPSFTKLYLLTLHSPWERISNKEYRKMRDSLSFLSSILLLGKEWSQWRLGRHSPLSSFKLFKDTSCSFLTNQEMSKPFAFYVSWLYLIIFIDNLFGPEHILGKWTFQKWGVQQLNPSTVFKVVELKCVCWNNHGIWIHYFINPHLSI